MTFDEIWKAGKQGKLDRFKAYDLLEARTEELSKTETENIKKWNGKEQGAYKDSKQYKAIEQEKNYCADLEKHIVWQTFADFAGKEYATQELLDIPLAIFRLHKAQFEKQDIEKTERNTAKKVIEARIEWLRTLVEKL